MKRQPQQKFFPKESKSQGGEEENNGFMNDPVPFTSSIGAIHNGALRPERSEAKTQVRDKLNTFKVYKVFRIITWLSLTNSFSGTGGL